ncbi:MAG: hypothetical protein OXF28_04860 [Thaumarchaeota archaeon]|nr:hypothetical protein [Nitrososphaerota archaeon]
MHEIIIYIIVFLISVFFILLLQIRKSDQYKFNINNKMYLKTKQNFIKKMIGRINNSNLIYTDKLKLLNKYNKNLSDAYNETKFEDKNSDVTADKIKSIIDERFLKFEDKNSDVTADKIKSIIDERFLKFENQLLEIRKKSNIINPAYANNKKNIIDRNCTEKKEYKNQPIEKNDKINYDDEVKKIKSEIIETLSKLDEIEIE